MGTHHGLDLSQTDTYSARHKDESIELSADLRERLQIQQAPLSDGATRFEFNEFDPNDVVVLVHGYTASSAIWGPVTDHLNRIKQGNLTYDLFGHGLSDRPKVPYNRALFGRQLKELLEMKVRNRNIHLVGWSMGAMIAAQYATENPDRVRSMTMASPSGLPIRMGLLGRIARIPIIGDIGYALIGGLGLRRVQRAFFEDPRALNAYMPLFDEQRRYSGFKRAMLSTLRHMNMDDFASGYASFGKRSIPTFVLWAKHDRATPFANSSTFLQLVPHAKLTALHSVGHASPFEQPDVIARAIQANIRNCQPKQEPKPCV